MTFLRQGRYMSNDDDADDHNGVGCCDGDDGDDNNNNQDGVGWCDCDGSVAIISVFLS